VTVDAADAHDSLPDDLVAAYTLNIDSVPREHIRLMAAELLGRRKIARRDSRRAQQIKKLRWLVESLLAKIERTEDFVDADDARPKGSP
jgi:hypothetical protein